MEDKPDQALLSDDNLDRASPDLWPEQNFGSLSTQQLMDKIKHLQNLAYQVGLEEAKEMTRGKFLNILGKR
ncbi:protein lin-52 [Paragonimus westermani]|uniref:Protein lin-52 n=1 Tax=Paragonimus westermani TaxID=34504 RepID=A0A5J4NDG0_9TREM|nr:protein lin-52 [Paragonimus westermani]